MAEIEAGQAHVAHEAALEALLHEYEETQYVTVPFHGGALHAQRPAPSDTPIADDSQTSRP